MNREDAKQYIHDHPEVYLQKDGSGKGYICPICGSGSGKNGTGMTTKDGIKFTCWAKEKPGCPQSSDLIDIIGAEYGLTGYNEKLQKAAELFNITIEEEAPRPRKQRGNDMEEKKTSPKSAEKEPDYTSFFIEAHKNIDKTDYHRGLSKETIDRFNVGFVESWRHPKAPKAPASPRLIIPTSPHSYLARDTRKEIPEEQKRYAKSKVGNIRIFNREALQNAQRPIFLVEGEIDALSIIDAGGEAIGLGSVAYINKFISLLKEHKPSQPIIIALDNDKAGGNATKTIADALKQQEIAFYIYNPAEGYKDANEALQANRDVFKATIEKFRDAETVENIIETEYLQRETVAYYLPDFLKSVIKTSKPFLPTGFHSLDKILDGGLYAGLYIVGAVSALGKTTLCLQIADQIAGQGEDVIIFSLEMAREELIAKSISRFTYLKDTTREKKNAKTTRGILTGTRYANYSPAETAIINTAIAEYAKIAEHIYIAEGVGNIGAEQIRERVEKHTRITGKAPIVVIDYLQIIAPADVRATDKQNTDKAVLELKRLSRDYNIPVIGVSSFNRDNYTAPVNLASFKESGAIEYSSDVLIGLQYKGMDYKEGDKQDSKSPERKQRVEETNKTQEEKARNKQPQDIQIKVLKNRNGSKGETTLQFYPMFNYFEDNTPKETPEATQSSLLDPEEMGDCFNNGKKPT